MIGNIFDVDLKLIRIFCCVVEAGGFTAAQTELNISLPRLSTMIGDLEARLGMRLCQRGRQGFRLTSEGASTYEAAQALLLELEKFRERITALSVRPVHQLKIGMVDGMASLPDAPMVRALQAFREDNPDTHVTLQVMKSDELEKAVLEQRLHIGIGAFHRALPGLHSHALYTEPYDLYCGQQHPLFADSTSALDLAAIGNADYVECGQLVENNKPGKIKFKHKASAYSMEAVTLLLLSGGYIGYLPVHHAQRLVEEGELAAIDTKTFQYASQVSYVVKQGVNGNSFVVNDFLRTLTSVFETPAIPGKQNIRPLRSAPLSHRRLSA